MSDTRSRIAAHVEAHPGVHFNEIVRTLDFAPGQVQYHLRRLLAGEGIEEERLYGQTHYYPAGIGERDRGALALLRRETARDIVGHLLAEGPSRPDDVADAVDVARSTLEWHVGHLEEQDLVRKERGSRNRVTLVPVRPEETERLLVAISPSLPDRFLDRFTRLVDRMMDEPS